MLDYIEWAGNYQGGIKQCRDCKNFYSKELMDKEYRNCKVIDKYFNNIKLLRYNNICKYFEYPDYLKFRITEKIDCLDGTWRFNDYFEWLYYDHYIDKPEYEEYIDGEDYYPTLNNPYVKWKYKGVWAITVQNLRKDLITTSFNFIKVDDMNYYMLLNNYIGLDFIDSKKLKYYGYWKDGRKGRNIYEIGEVELS